MSCKFIFDNIDFILDYYDDYSIQYKLDKNAFTDSNGGAFNYTLFMSPTDFKNNRNL
jgi:hypothetical protein